MAGVPRTLAELDWPFRTERLTLRRAEQRDAAATFAFRSLPEVARWLTSHPTDLEAWTDGFGERIEDTLVVELDGVVVGDLMVRFEDPWSQAEVREQAAGTQVEIGYVFDPAHAGRGYATEAVREELRICFEDLGVRRVVAACFADNEASWRLMERVGMRREQHTKQDSLHRSGEWLDGMMYAVLREEWLSSR
jgi:RimJ/RimL family protein N-acetyltransferase